jgi:DNA-binding NarL/FixJ family response regulator
MSERGEMALAAPDRQYGEGVMTRVRRQASEMDIELAMRDGAAADPLELLRSLPTLLRAGDGGPARSSTRLRHGELTKREVEILSLVGQGRGDQEIAEALFISPKTASVHVANVKGKLGLNSRLEIALYAREHGLAESRPN